MKFAIRFSLTFLLILLWAATVQARIINIPEDRQTIQAGISAASNSDTVLVQPGVYVENINFQGRNIFLTSRYIFTGNEQDVAETIIDGDRNGTSVVQFDSEGTLCGFTIRNGLSEYGGGIDCWGEESTLRNLIIENNEAEENGGGIVMSIRAGHLFRLVVRNNRAGVHGGGIFYAGMETLMDTLLVEDNTCGDRGGGISIWHAEAEVANSTIQRNTGGEAGGIYVYSIDYPVFRNLTIMENVATEMHGGMRIFARARMENIWFVNNRCEGNGAGGLHILTLNTELINVWAIGNSGQYGGGISIRNAEPTLTNVLVIENHASDKGGGINISHGGGILTNLTVAGNSNGNNAGSAMALDTDGETILRNSIICGQDRDFILMNGNNDLALDVNYCDIVGEDCISQEGECQLVWGENNINADPLFVDPQVYDYDLQENSPCIDSGDPESPLDPDSTRADMGAFPFHHRDIEINPVELVFANVQTGTVDSLALTIRNIGMAPLMIGSQTISPENSPFAICQGGGEVEIAPESEHLTWILFTPEQDGNYNARMIIQSDDPDEETVEIPITGSALGVETESPPLPVEFSITMVFPNPFNSATTIGYQLPTTSHVSIKIYDQQGHQVATLVKGNMQAGNHWAPWIADNHASGIYFCRMEAGSHNRTVKLLLTK